MSSTSQASRSRPARPRPSQASSTPATTTAQHATTVDASDSRVTIPLVPRRTSSRSTRSAVPDSEEKRCWICFVSESEEDQPRSEWKSPCQCSLVAHESCLLDWIADVQANGATQKLECPQCKTPIRLKEQESLVLDIADKMTVFMGNAGAFVAFGGLGSVIFVGATVYGVNTIYTICGPEYAHQILVGPDEQFHWSWRLGFGLPLIPVVLIASRTRLLDSVLPVLPVLFFCHTDPLHFTLPPSPQITLALLPYIRSIYNHLWKRYIATYETKWIRETTPTFALENAEQQQQQRQRNNNNRNAGALAANGNDHEHEHEWNGELLVENHNVILQGSNVTTLVLGALLWPSVAKMAGQGMIGKWPAAWGGDRVRRWLPSQLARNVVGGLMVVVLKDFISLYCKYKRAQKFRSRTVMNYSEVKKERAKERARGGAYR